jgi:hypothetical protein
MDRIHQQTPWYTLAAACTLGQVVCWTCLTIFYAKGRSNIQLCIEVSCANAGLDGQQVLGTGGCGSQCTMGVPFFSYCGYYTPEYYVFGVGLTMVMLVGLAGVESVNRMYLTLGHLCGMPVETNLCWCEP